MRRATGTLSSPAAPIADGEIVAKESTAQWVEGANAIACTDAATSGQCGSAGSEGKPSRGARRFHARGCAR